MSNFDIVVPPVNPNPTENDPVVGQVFRPRRKSEFLTSMLRTVGASGAAIMRYGRGSLPHRLLELVAIELELLSFEFRDAVRRAIREAGYRAFYHPELFLERGSATFARGYVLLSSGVPLTADEVVEEGDVFGTADGRTVRAAQRTVFKAGARSVAVPVVAEMPGTAGNIPSGAITQYLNRRAAYLVTNPSAVSGGREEESDAEIHARFLDYVQSLARGSATSVRSAVMNARLAGERPVDAVLVMPWRIPQLNGDMGFGFVIVDTGSGSASEALVAAAQRNVDGVVSFGQEIRVRPCSQLIVNLDLHVETTRFGNAAQIEALARQVWTGFCAQQPIEDGTGRSALKAVDLKSLFDRLPGVLTVTLRTPADGVRVPLGARIVEGALTMTVERGQ